MNSLNRRRLVILAALLPALPVLADDDAQPILQMPDLYNRDMSFSPGAEGMAGQRVSFSGFMAPPLRADSNFFVLTRRPMAVCPFCEADADWPPDILAVYTKRRLRVVPFNQRIKTRGVLELGGYTDPDTGFRSRARLVDSTVERA